MDYTRDLHELCGTIYDAIAEANEKIHGAGGKLSAGDVDYVDKLTHALKSVKAVMAMEDEGYSGDYGRIYARRDDRGRYSGRYQMNYSRRGSMVDELRDLMENAPDDRTRQEFQRFISRIENA